MWKPWKSKETMRVRDNTERVNWGISDLKEEMVKMGEFSVGVVRRKIEQDEGKIRISVSEKVKRMPTIHYLKN